MIICEPLWLWLSVKFSFPTLSELYLLSLLHLFLLLFFFRYSANMILEVVCSADCKQDKDGSELAIRTASLNMFTTSLDSEATTEIYSSRERQANLCILLPHKARISHILGLPQCFPPYPLASFRLSLPLLSTLLCFPQPPWARLREMIKTSKAVPHCRSKLRADGWELDPT